VHAGQGFACHTPPWRTDSSLSGALLVRQRLEQVLATRQDNWRAACGHRYQQTWQALALCGVGQHSSHTRRLGSKGSLRLW
jgi:hypothetical protein